MSLPVEAIAKVAHEVNRTYCSSFICNDRSQPPWEEAPEWQRDSALAGVRMHLVDPTLGPEASHQAWLEHKAAEGWTYGEMKDPEKKLHPCMVPYEHLPAEQKLKDALFKTVIDALRDHA